jgi:hypothetical protein
MSERDHPGQRIGATIALMLMVATCGQSDVPSHNYGLASAESQRCTDAETAEIIRHILIQALDEALKDHVTHVFAIWMRDETGQPERARTGARSAVNAYIRARAGAHEWKPPVCPVR